MPKILIVESHDKVRWELVHRFIEAGLEVISASDFQQAQSLVKTDSPHFLILDINEEHPEALKPLQKLLQEHPETRVFATAALGSIQTAVQAIKMGAVDFLLKPYSPAEMISRIKEYLEGTGKGDPYRISSPVKKKQVSVVGISPAIKDILHLIEKISNTNKTVLIVGESGVGKTLFASLIHEMSPRSVKPLLFLNCPAFSTDVFLESELFGFVEDAFEGAGDPREGVLIKANGGTVILEDIVDLPPSTQAKLLSYLETGEFRRVGENIPIKTDTRIIATTRKDLKPRVKAGDFRNDLFFRLKNVAFEIPPLRKRREDIPPLIKHFLRRLNRRGGRHYRMDKDAVSTLCSLSYYGNVLELKNRVEQIISVSHGEQISMEILEKAKISRKERKTSALLKVAKTEKKVIEDVIKKYPRNMNAAAKELGLSRTTLWRRMKKYDLLTRDQDSIE